uniref:Nudix hydrolase domain-containing protein n=1 Tax=Spongospora subterranea TaxID=70186 RepID=A0A0H5RPI4_9EUKA|eukprot:CRZ10634.1 hypothetical protein [Spongospora subterranea]
MAISHRLAVALDDLSSRFFLNLPEEELGSFDRLFFQLEQAWWFYEDFYREQNPNSLPKFSFRDFCFCLFEQSSALRPHIPNFELYFKQFREYLCKVPVCGAAMLDESMTACVLVKGWTGKSWGFPKGKINQGEPSIDCAVREVLEETGVSIASLVSDRHVIQAVANGKSTHLYIAPNVPITTEFSTQTRKEISDIRWFTIDSILETDDSRFWNVSPFIHKLRTWISRHRHLARTPIHECLSSAGEFHRKGIPADKIKKKKRPTAAQPILQRRSRCHASKDDYLSDSLTFGTDRSSWTPEEMFAENARLFGVRTTQCTDPNELTTSMAMQGTMAGSVQWKHATATLDSAAATSSTSKSSIIPSPSPALTPAPLPPDGSRSNGSRNQQNALLNFDLDDAMIMSHFFQA